MRLGIGYDVHAFSEKRDLILGGVKIPYHLGLRGHSDADVLLHAICDAILGATKTISLYVGDDFQYFENSENSSRRCKRKSYHYGIPGVRR